MQNRETFNPDIPYVNIETGEHTDSPDSEIGARSKRKMKPTDAFSLVTSKKVRVALGFLLIFIGAYLLIASISYIAHGLADQSELSREITTMSEASTVKNTGAILGAQLTDFLIEQGIGLAVIALIVWLATIGYRLVAMKRVFFLSYTLITMLNIICFTMVLGAISCCFDLLFFPLGGNIGKYLNELLIIYIGKVGMIFVNLFIVIVWALVLFNTLKHIYDTIHHSLEVANKRLTRNRKPTNEETGLSAFIGEEVKDDQANSDEEKTEEKDLNNADSTSDMFEPQRETEKPIKPKTLADEKSDELGESSSDEVKMTVVENEIEEANGKINDTFDPTKELPNYKFPELKMLRDFGAMKPSVDNEERENNKRRITETLLNYKIEITRIDVHVGPTITLYEIVPKAGVRISQIKNLENDIAMSLAALGIRIIAPMPGRGTVGIEVPNKDPQIVPMKTVIGSKAFQDTKAALPMALGVTVSNEVFIADMAKMPHLLVAGATGQGKSVGLNAIITSLLYKKHPSELKFVLVDPKMVEFSLYSKIDHHYLAKLPEEEKSIITDSQRVIATLNSLVVEMEDRYKLLEMAGERNIKDYNARFINRTLNPNNGHKYLPYIVVIVDEFADLIMVAGKEVETPIVRIAQKARAVGIHMIIATQRPSTNVITGIIKANFPGRIAFRVTQMVDSRTIIDRPGAEQLVGKGDMLFSADGEITRLQCAFVDTPEVQEICKHIGDQVGFAQVYPLPDYVPEGDSGASSGGGNNLNDRDSLFEEAAMFVITNDVASTSSLQRRYQIGYNRAGRIMDQLEAAGIVGPSQGGKPRKVLMDSIQLQMFFDQ